MTSIGKVMAKMEEILVLDKRPGRVLVSPAFYHEMIQEMAMANTSFGVEGIERLLGLPVLVVLDVQSFEVSIK